MDALRKDIENEMNLLRVDKSQLYNTLLRIIDLIPEQPAPVAVAPPPVATAVAPPPVVAPPPTDVSPIAIPKTPKAPRKSAPESEVPATPKKPGRKKKVTVDV